MIVGRWAEDNNCRIYSWKPNVGSSSLVSYSFKFYGKQRRALAKFGLEIARAHILKFMMPHWGSHPRPDLR
jgi:hypothetical protein